MNAAYHLNHYLHDEKHCVIQLPDRVEYESVHGLEAEIRSILGKCGGISVLLDFSTCGYVNSSGLRLIVTMKNITEKMHIPMAMAGPNLLIRQLLEMTSIAQLVPIYDTIEDALLHI